MKNMNSKGFTLVELLAAIVILSIIMVVAVPNVIGMVNNSKKNTYVEDAKKLASTAEYKFKASKIEKPTETSCVIISLRYLDNSEIKESPNNEEYDKDNSYVIIQNEVKAVSSHNNYSRYRYTTVLKEKDSSRGVFATNMDTLYTKKSKDLVKENISVSQTGNEIKITGGSETFSCAGQVYKTP